MKRIAPATAIVMLGLALPVGPAHGGDSTPGCLDGSANEAVAAGDDGGPPKFTSRFFRQAFELDVSTDGFTRRYLTISIEDVCNVPSGYATQAVQLAGSDGVAVISSRTRVYKGKRLLKGAPRRAQIDGADTMRLKVKLLPPARWRPGEDDRVPTFSTSRVLITD
jgi:hypothetical protein